MSNHPLNGHIGKLFFLKTFLKDRNIGAVLPSSPYFVKRILSTIDFARDNIVVEYGPGTGVFTKILLDKLSPASTLILIDTNPEFVKLLRKVDDPRVRVFHDSAENIQGILKECGLLNADYIFSGIPFSFFSKDLKMRIINNTRGAIGKTGKFVVYQYSAHVRRYLKQSFRSVNSDFELFHIPPMFVFEATN